MQMIPLNLALVPTKTATSQKPRTASRTSASTQGRVKSQAEPNEFSPLAFQDFIEGEFEDLSDELNQSSPKKGYVETLLPYFLFKSRYVNCYI